MKITPTLHNIYIGMNKPHAKQKSSVEQVCVENNKREYSFKYPSMIVFAAKKEKFNAVDFDKKLANLDGVRCPCCGEAMVSRKTSSDFIAKAYKTPTAREFSLLLKDVKPYVRSGFDLLIHYYEKNADKNPNMPASEVCNMLAAGAGKIITNRINYQADYLSKVVEEDSLSVSDCQKINQCVKELKAFEKVPKWNDVKKVLKTNLGQMESSKKRVYYSHVRDKVLEAYSYNAVLRCDEMRDGRQPRQVTLMKKMLETSISRVDNLYQNQYEDKRFNRLLICPECYINPSKFLLITKSEDSEKKMINYVRDIARNIAQDKLEGDNGYLYEFVGAVNKQAKGRYRIERDGIQGVAQLKIFREIKSDFVFENYEGVPCATCSTEMLPHSKKLQIYKEIEDCENLHELKHIANMYAQNVTPKGRVPFYRFNEILRQNPDISDKEMFKKLRELSGQDVVNEMLIKQQKMKEFAKNNELNALDQILLVDYLCKLDEVIESSKNGNSFIYEDYDKIVVDTIGKMLHPDKKELVKIAKDNTKTLYVQDNLVRPLPQIVAKMGSRSKVMLQNIFKLASFTVDHTLAISLGGPDHYSNKIGYCKDCNNEKSGMHFSSWVAIHPEMNVNLPKHFKKISEIIRDENLDRMHDYPMEAAQRAVKLSRGNLHIPTKYNTY